MGKAELAMTPLQQWGEEAEEGAVYSILLQRLKAEPHAAAAGGSPSSSRVDANLPGCPFVHYRTCKRRVLRAATLPALVRWLLASEAEGDVGYLPSFLATYPAFATLGQVLELLLPLWPDQAVLRVLELWLQSHPEDFWEPPEHPSLRRTLHFLHQFAPGSPASALAEGLLRTHTKQEEAAEEEKTGEEAAGGESPGVGRPQVLPEAPSQEFPALLSFAVEEVAEQLTLMDSELFRAVRPSHCLGCVWSQRDKKERQQAAPSVRATVAQFNAVTSCVVTSMLEDPTLRVQQRAQLLEKWIDIAQHCRTLRNFSSLYAILSALQSSPIYRLKRTWSAVSRNARSTFHKLSEIFSEDNNHLNCREILLQNGAASSPGEGCSGPQALARTPLKQSPPSRQPPPTVPYLGTFLTDLVMLDTALPDVVEGHLINFEKRRKEAETLALIRQLQESCRGYSLRLSPSFHRAFWGQQKLSEEQRAPSSPGPRRLAAVQEALTPHPHGPLCRVSRAIEPPASSCPNSPKLHRSLTKRFSSLLLGSDASAPPPGPDRAGAPHLHSREGLLGAPPCQASQLAGSGEGPPSPTPLVLPTQDLPAPQPRPPCPPLAPALPPPSAKRSGTESRIIRVSLEDNNGQGNLYRSIVITSQDKTAAVVRRALQKHNLGHAPQDSYQLLQRLGDGQELLIPSNANTFYAMSPASPADFLLRHKEEEAAPPGGRTPCPRTPPPLPRSTTALPAPSGPAPSLCPTASSPLPPPSSPPGPSTMAPPIPGAPQPHPF